MSRDGFSLDQSGTDVVIIDSIALSSNDAVGGDCDANCRSSHDATHRVVRDVFVLSTLGGLFTSVLSKEAHPWFSSHPSFPYRLTDHVIPVIHNVEIVRDYTSFEVDVCIVVDLILADPELKDHVGTLGPILIVGFIGPIVNVELLVKVRLDSEVDKLAGLDIPAHMFPRKIRFELTVQTYSVICRPLLRVSGTFGGGCSNARSQSTRVITKLIVKGPSDIVFGTVDCDHSDACQRCRG